MRCNNNSFKNFIAVKLLTSITEIVFDCAGGFGGDIVFDGGIGKFILDIIIYIITIL